MSEIRCIFCTELKEVVEFNEEHVFPEGIGGHLTINRVCTECNSKLGSKVDHHLTNHYFIEVFRKENGILGKTGKLPPVYTHGVLTDDPDQKVHIITDSNGEVERIKLLTKKESITGKDGIEIVRISGDGSDESAHLQTVNKVLKRNKLPEMSREEFRSKLKSEKLGPEINVTVEKDIDLFDFIRALAKIAYELTWRWLGDSYINDPQAMVIRDFIWNGKQNGKYPFIKHAGFTPTKAQLNAAQHQGLLEIRKDQIRCSVLISNIFIGDFQMSFSPQLYRPGFSLAAVINDAVKGEIFEEKGSLD